MNFETAQYGNHFPFYISQLSKDKLHLNIESLSFIFIFRLSKTYIIQPLVVPQPVSALELSSRLSVLKQVFVCAHCTGRARASREASTSPGPEGAANCPDRVGATCWLNLWS